LTTLIFDFEATGSQTNRAHPYDLRNKACNVGFRVDGNNKIWKLEYDDSPYGGSLKEIQKLLDDCTMLVGFNLKYDLSWLHRYGLVVKPSTRLFDCQVAYFILTNQRNSYPSLDEVAEFCGTEKKLDVVKLEYWEKGIDTDQVPYEILSEYLEQDLVVTESVYNVLQDIISAQSPKMQKLISMSMQDLRVLFDIEKNGLLLDVAKCHNLTQQLESEIQNIDDELRRIFKAPWLNPNSGEHLSCVLYGGTIYVDGKEDYEFVYKDGRTATKSRNIKIPHTSPRLFNPLEKSELAKEGFYATNEPTLTAIAMKAKGEYKKILDLILLRAKKEKLVSTYFKGFPKRNQEMGWFDDIMHSSFNQCVAQSGRLSSTKPNVQNIAGIVKEVIISRFGVRK
jgi:DNA polymerase-1